MSTQVDLTQLAVDRGTSAVRLRARQHVLTRYVLPGILLLGFLALVAWTSRDAVFPPKSVTVVPVLSSQAEAHHEGTQLFKAAGWIEPRPTAIRVAALAPGVVERLLVIEDQSVKKGEPVAELVKDDARLEQEAALADFALREAELEIAKAALAAAITRFEQPVHLAASLGEAEAALAKTETELKNLPFETRRAEAQLGFAKKDHDGNISAKEAVSDRVTDASESHLESTQALVEELHGRATSLKKEQLALAQRRDALKTQLELLAEETRARDEAKARVKAAQARVEQARVGVAETELQLERMTVRAPVNGRIYQLVIDPGARLGSGMLQQMPNHDGSTVVTMYRPEVLQVRVDVRFEDIPKVSFGQPVQIENPAIRSPLTGTVLFVSSEADIQKNTLEVKVAIAAPDAVFKPDMLVDVTFLASPRDENETKPSLTSRLYVPEPLIRRDGAGAYVWLADQSAGVARRTPVEIGTTTQTGLVEVIHGLSVTSRLIVRGADSLVNGDRIHIVGESSSLVSSPTTQGSDD